MMVWLRSLPFLLLFPAYFIYHWAAINDLIPLFFGGFINEVSAFVCVYFLIVFLCQRIHIRSLISLDMLFLIFMIWFAFVILLNFSLMTAPGVSKNHTAAFLQISAVYLAVRYVGFDESQRVLMWMAFLLGLSVIWVAINSPIELLVAGSDESSIANYQSLSRSFLLIAIFGISFIWMRVMKWAWYLFAVTVLFLLGARTELIGFFIFIAVFELFSSTNPVRYFFIIAVIVMICVVTLYSSLSFLIELFPDNRALYLLQIGVNDESVTSRSVAQLAAWSAILDSPLFGDYGHYEKSFSAGFYAHNWLGVWVDLGLFGLVIFFSLHGYATWIAFRIYKFSLKINDLIFKKKVALAMGVLAMVIAFNLFAKNFADSGLAVAIALLASLMTSRQSKKNENSIFLAAESAIYHNPTIWRRTPDIFLYVAWKNTTTEKLNQP
jgi:hypothetical protein